MYDELVKRLRMRAHLFKQINQMENSIMDDAADAIEELSKPRWIPVTEQLPEHDKNVLICYEWTGRSRTVYREVGIASIEELERDPTEMFRPLYWMPLPEPPKEEA